MNKPLFTVALFLFQWARHILYIIVSVNAIGRGKKACLH